MKLEIKLNNEKPFFSKYLISRKKSLVKTMITRLMIDETKANIENIKKRKKILSETGCCN